MPRTLPGRLSGGVCSSASSSVRRYCSCASASSGTPLCKWSKMRLVVGRGLVDLAQGDDALQEDEVVLLRSAGALAQSLTGSRCTTGGRPCGRNDPGRRSSGHRAGSGAGRLQRISASQARRRTKGSSSLRAGPGPAGASRYVVDADQVDGLGADLGVPVQDQ